MLYFSGDSCNCLKKGDLEWVVQISTSPFESLMLQNLDPHIYISSHDSWQLIALAVKYVVVLVRHSRLDRDLELFLLFFHSLAFTSFAFGFLCYLLPQSTALLATHLSLCIHSWTQLDHFHCDPLPFAILALLNFASPFAVTVSTNSVPSDSDLFHRTQIDLLKCDFQFDQFGLHFLWLVILLLWVEEVENVRTYSRRATILHSFFSILVIQLPLFGVSESVIGFLEVLKAIRVTPFVGMFFECFLSECLLDLLGGCIFGKFKEFVVLCGIDLFLSLCWLACRLILPVFLVIAKVAPKKHSSTILIYYALRLKQQDKQQQHQSRQSREEQLINVCQTRQRQSCFAKLLKVDLDWQLYCC